MKKIFLLALTLVLICSSLFAAVNSSKEAKISLNLAGVTSVINLGFINTMDISAVSLDKITSAGFEGSTLLEDLPIALDETTLTTKAGTFSIWYFFNAVNKGTDGISLTLTVTPFKDVTVGSTEPTVGYKLSKGDVKSFGEIPAMAESYEIPASGSLDIEIFTNRGVSGIHKGYLSYNVDSFDYAKIKALNYDSELTLSIVAP